MGQGDSASKEREGVERRLAMRQKLLEAGLREESTFLWGKWLCMMLCFLVV